MTTEPRKAMLHHAAELITGDRNKTYGTPTQNFTDTAKIWSVQLRHMLKDGVEITPALVSQLMMSLKLCRLIASPTADTYIDIAGYAGCGYEVEGFGAGSTDEAYAAAFPTGSLHEETVDFGDPEPRRDTTWKDIDGDVWRWYGSEIGWQVSAVESGDGTTWETIPEIYFPMVRVA